MNEMQASAPLFGLCWQERANNTRRNEPCLTVLFHTRTRVVTNLVPNSSLCRIRVAESIVCRRKESM